MGASFACLLFAFPQEIGPSFAAQQLAAAVILSSTELAPAERIRKPGMAKTVLIVEDNELNMKLFHDLLEAHGYATLATRNGIAALELARRHRPHLILMDIRLRAGSGLQD